MTYRKSSPVRRSAFLGSLGALVAGFAATLLVAGGAAAEPTLAGKRAEAERVLAQIREIDSQVAHAAEDYNRATIELGRIQAQQKKNKKVLGVSRRSLGAAQKQLQERLVAIYTSGEATGTLEIILGATSIEDILNRLEAVDRVSGQDAVVLKQVTSFKNRVQKQKRQLAKARTRQERMVAERAAQRRAVQAKLSERQALLASIEDEIAKIQARERARQLTLVRQARARVAARRLTPDAGQTQAAEAALEQIAEAPPSKYGGVVGIAMKYLGIPYRWGGSSPSGGFDCSGFIMYVYSQIGVSLPHNAAMQFGYGVPVAKSDLQPGDLVFFDGLGHNGIYIGGGQFIHSPHTGDVVKISSLNDSWYSAKWYGAKRLP